VVAGDDHTGGRLLQRVQVDAGVRELRVRTALGQVAGDGHRVGPALLDKPSQGIEALGDRGPPEVQIRNVHEGGHEKGFYPNTPARQTPVSAWPLAALVSAWQERIYSVAWCMRPSSSWSARSCWRGASPAPSPKKSSGLPLGEA
jgi:hypothetical protein